MMRQLLILVALAGAASAAMAQTSAIPQCLNGQCPLRPPGSSMPSAIRLPTIINGSQVTIPPAAEEYRWLRWDQDPTRVYLYKGKKQIGAYDLDEHYYRELLNERTGEWAPNSKPPISPPVFGVDTDKLPRQESYRLNGNEVRKDVAMEVLANGLNDDTSKLRVTVVDPDQKGRQQIVEDLRKIPEGESFAVREYDPKAWELSSGFSTTGTPTIYFQAPNGKVLHRQDDYQGGAAPTIEALRKAKASYDPKMDPDLRKPQATSSTSYASYLLPALGGVLIALLYLRKAPTHAAH